MILESNWNVQGANFCRIDNGGCPKNTRCVLNQVFLFCITAPCPPQVTCIPIGKLSSETITEFVTAPLCSRDLGGGCPPGVPLVQCLVDPCSIAKKHGRRSSRDGTATSL